ncbi:Predicted carbonic anhydrase involved in protection against oxidative damage [Ceraceosorus bombacis]|uniref:Carbonic anhydrase n=1 Tax=Ceraceosorus bombacis TaxID=401625 RepID=A0A0P1BE04_9BASI|nr:Predicted carbonic anhydrase involved in protection against oxidative damage [Ceraceosorus bombacis]
MTTTLATILSRNDSWVSSYGPAHIEEFKANAQGQSPKVLWIGCSDSRVPEGVVCQTAPGELFVHRNIAGQFNPKDDSANSVLTYAVEALGVEQIVVVGHTSCGGVAASLQCAASKQDLPSAPLARYLTPLISLADKIRASPEAQGLSEAELVQLITERSVKQQMENIVESDVIKANWAGKKSAFPGEASKKVEVHGWVHNIATGKITDLGISILPPQ